MDTLPRHLVMRDDTSDHSRGPRATEPARGTRVCVGMDGWTRAGWRGSSRVKEKVTPASAFPGFSWESRGRVYLTASRFLFAPLDASRDDIITVYNKMELVCRSVSRFGVVALLLAEWLLKASQASISK